MSATAASASNRLNTVSTLMLLELGAGALAPSAEPMTPTAVLACDADPDSIDLQAACLAIEFPAFNDGRGLSLAVLLRTRLGYTGELRAVGETHPELYHYLFRCGFDTVAYDGTYELAAIQAAYTPHQQSYQGSVRDPRPVFRRVN